MIVAQQPPPCVVVPVTLPRHRYGVRIGRGALSFAKDDLKQRLPGYSPSSIVLVTDAGVYRFYASLIETFVASLFSLNENDQSPLKCKIDTIRPGALPIGSSSSKDEALSSAPKVYGSSLVIVLPEGEESKSREVKGWIEDRLLERRCDKDTLFVGFGGGMVGDLTGFVSATFYRGCRFVNVPTSLLAMVDSAVGGKTAVNILPMGKNLIGNYHHPVLVLADLCFVDTLERRLIAEGFAEIIKMGLTSMADVFWECERLSHEFKANRSLPVADLHELVRRAVEFKAHVVQEDERDLGLRNILNFGHTVGHGLESLPSNKWLHGECVAVGTVYELLALRAMGRCGKELPQVAEDCLKNYNLPTRMGALTPDEVEGLFRSMGLDKKNKKGAITVVVVEKIGKTATNLMAGVPVQLLRRCLLPAVSLGGGEALNAPKPVNGKVILPGSKSVANRALLLAAMAHGQCLLSNLPASQDVAIMKSILFNTISVRENLPSTQSVASEVCVEGLGLSSQMASDSKPRPLPMPRVDGAGVADVWVENAGTATRFLPPLFALILSQQVGSEAVRDSESGKSLKLTAFRMDGNSHMRVRPIGDLMEAVQLAFPAIGVEYLGAVGCLPLKMYVKASAVPTSTFPGGRLLIKNKTSSQFVTALLLAAPFAASPVELHLEELSPLANPAEEPKTTEADPTECAKAVSAVSQPYIDMTIQMMKLWGVTVERLAPGVYRVPSGVYTNPSKFAVEADASAASYPLAMAAISGGRVSVNLPLPPPRTNKEEFSGLQGDVKFVEVLGAMGCEIERDVPSEGFVTVEGPPNGRLRPYRCNMNEMTDTFMTAAVLMASAASYSGITAEEGAQTDIDNVSEIRGVENQRVKECNRIDATVTNLRRCGFIVQELQDGLRIFPSKLLSNAPVVVDCQNDHRLAMSFAVLALRCPNLIVPEWRCVEKTFPDFWDVCAKDLGIPVNGATQHIPSPIVSSALLASVSASVKSTLHEASPAVVVPHGHIEPLSPEDSQPLPPIVLVGMRNSGKTTLARLLERHRREECHFIKIDVDEELGFDVLQYVQTNGWKAFREAELAAFKRALERAQAPPPSDEKSPGMTYRYVIACGGGIVETPAAVEILAQLPLVVWIRMNEADCIPKLAQQGNGSKPDYGEPQIEVYKRRKPLYKQVSKFEFTYPGDACPQDVLSSFFSFIGSLLGHPSAGRPLQPPSESQDSAQQNWLDYMLTAMEGTGMLCLTLPTYKREALPSKVIESGLFEGVVVVELRADLLRDLSDLPSEIFYLRCLTDKPIIVTLRSTREGGEFIESIDENKAGLLYQDAIEIALRAAVHFIDIEAARLLESSSLRDLLGFPATKDSAPRGNLRPKRLIISSHVLEHPIPATDWVLKEQLRSLTNLCKQRGSVDVAKLVYGEGQTVDSLRLSLAAREVSRHTGVPIISLTLGATGRSSRVLNGVMTPATHPSLLNIAAPGQLSLEEIAASRMSLGLQTKFYFVAGCPVERSPSVVFHNHLFQSVKLNHCIYGRYCTTSAHDVLNLFLRTPNVCGASVTIPLKTALYDAVVQRGDDRGNGSWYLGRTDTAKMILGFPDMVERLGVKTLLELDGRDESDMIVRIDTAALRLKAINTVYRSSREKGTLWMGNTDYLAILIPLREAAEKLKSSRTILIIGAGGTARAACYAAEVGGFEAMIWNRSSGRAEDLLKDFPRYTRLQSTQQIPKEGFLAVVGTVPGTNKVLTGVDTSSIFEGRPRVIEMAYTPHETTLISMARPYGCKVHYGVDGFVHQGVAQSIHFLEAAQATDKSASAEALAEAVVKARNFLGLPVALENEAV